MKKSYLRKVFVGLGNLVQSLRLKIKILFFNVS